MALDLNIFMCIQFTWNEVSLVARTYDMTRRAQSAAATADRIADSIGFRVGGFPSKEDIASVFESVTMANPQRRPEDFEKLRERIVAATT